MNEIIDKYLNGELSAEEKQKFEATIIKDEQLRNEVEAYRLIISAFKRNKIKQNLQIVEKQIQGKEQRQKWIKITSYSLAMAACITFAVMYVGTVNTYKNYGEYYFGQTTEYSFRGGDDVDDLISEAYEQIANAEYSKAISNLTSAQEILDSKTFDMTTEEGVYLAQMAMLKQQDIQWYKAIAYMRNGNIRKAKKLLKDIRNSDSKYSENAKNILERKHI